MLMLPNQEQVMPLHFFFLNSDLVMSVVSFVIFFMWPLLLLSLFLGTWYFVVTGIEFFFLLTLAQWLLLA